MRAERFDNETKVAILRAVKVEKLPFGAIAAAVRANQKTVKHYYDAACKEPTTCPDDLIRPCILRFGHVGCHEGGRA
jgi:hypothetical protein